MGCTSRRWNRSGTAASCEPRQLVNGWMGGWNGSIETQNRVLSARPGAIEKDAAGTRYGGLGLMLADGDASRRDTGAADGPAALGRRVQAPLVDDGCVPKRKNEDISAGCALPRSSGLWAYG